MSKIPVNEDEEKRGKPYLDCHPYYCSWPRCSCRDMQYVMLQKLKNGKKEDEKK